MKKKISGKSSTGPSMTTIRRHLKELRTLMDTSKDPIEQRIAYAMNTAIFWSMHKTVGWPRMAEEAKILASILRKELEL